MDATNAVRRGGWDPRFPEVEEARVQEFVERLSLLAGPHEGRVTVELVFDGPRREVGPARSPVTVRFAGPFAADDIILGSVRAQKAAGRGVVVATEDGNLAAACGEEGAKVVRFGELLSRLRSGKA